MFIIIVLNIPQRKTRKHVYVCNHDGFNEWRHHDQYNYSPPCLYDHHRPIYTVIAGSSYIDRVRTYDWSSWRRPADELSIELEFVKVRVTAKLVYRTPATYKR